MPTRRRAARPVLAAVLVGLLGLGAAAASGGGSAAPRTAAPAPRAPDARAGGALTDAGESTGSMPRLPGGARLGTDSSGRVLAVLSAPGHPLARPAGLPRTATPRQLGDAYVREYGQDLHVRPQDVGAPVIVQTGESDLLRYDLRADGLPVFSGQLVVALDGAGRLTSMTGHGAASPGPFGTVSAARAQAVARAAAARAARVSAVGLRAGAATALAYDPSRLGDSRTQAVVPVWQVQVTGGPVRELVLVDSRTAAPVLVAGQDEQATVRRTVCDFANKKVSDDVGGYGCTVGRASRTEGGPASSIADVNNAYDYAGQASNFYSSVLGVDLTGLIGTSDGSTGAPKTLRLSTRVCLTDSTSCPYANSFWDGAQVVLGSGYPTAADIVAHELTHGVTQHTNALAYVFSSGAINESMSDVFGELSQLWNARVAGQSVDPGWLIGEQLPTGPLRSMSDPPRYGQPNAMTSSLYTVPLDWTLSGWDNGGVHTDSGVGNQAAALLARGGTLSGVTVTGLGTSLTGLTQLAQIYWRTQQLLPSGSTYADLADSLTAACSALAGSGTAGITTSTCTSVAQAISATRMTTLPSGSVISPTSTPVCDAGQQPASPVFSDGFDQPNGTAMTAAQDNANWTFTAATTTGRGYTGITNLYASTGGDPGNDPQPVGGGSMVGVSADSAPSTPYNPMTPVTYTSTSRQFLVPAGSNSYLRFAHADEFEGYARPTLMYVPGSTKTFTRTGYYDGGRVWVNDLTTKKSMQPVTFVNNGYDRRLVSDPTQPTGMTAFGGYSGGYEVSRVNLSAFAGDKVQLVFQTVGDGYITSDWVVDDVSVYQCMPVAVPAAVTGIQASDDGAGDVTVSWAAGAGAAPTSYTVTPSTGTPQTVAGSVHSAVFTGVDTTRDATYTIVATNGTGTGPPATLQRLGTGLGMTATTAPVVPAGHLLGFAGLLRQPSTGAGLAGATVAVYFCPKAAAQCGTSDWTSTVSVFTDGSGKFRISVTAAGSGSWQARYAGAPDRSAAGSTPQYVTVTP